jgi:hypothetical protein
MSHAAQRHLKFLISGIRPHSRHLASAYITSQHFECFVIIIRANRPLTHATTRFAPAALHYLVERAESQPVTAERPMKMPIHTTPSR